jgi:hypothetical protein
MRVLFTTNPMAGHFHLLVPLTAAAPGPLDRRRARGSNGRRVDGQIRRPPMSPAPPRVRAYAARRRTRPEGLSGATDRTPALTRTGAVSGRAVGIRHPGMGRTAAPAGQASGGPHHASGESATDVPRGRVDRLFREGPRERHATDHLRPGADAR